MQHALTEAPGAKRFVLKEIIDGTSSLIAEEVNPTINPQRINSENLSATRAFLAVLQAEAPGIDVEEVVQQFVCKLVFSGLFEFSTFVSS